MNRDREPFGAAARTRLQGPNSIHHTKETPMSTITRRHTTTALGMLGAAALAVAGCGGTTSPNRESGSAPYAHKPTASQPTATSAPAAPTKRAAKRSARPDASRSTQSGGEVAQSSAQSSTPSSHATGGAAASPATASNTPAAPAERSAKPHASRSTQSSGEAAQPSMPTSSATGGAAASAIPQNDGGDMDTDNNGGPSDGDGNV